MFDVLRKSVQSVLICARMFNQPFASFPLVGCMHTPVQPSLLSLPFFPILAWAPVVRKPCNHKSSVWVTKNIEVRGRVDKLSKFTVVGKAKKR